MITKAQVKEIQSLTRSKGRAEYGAYLAEGDKLAKEWLSSDHRIRYVVASSVWIDNNETLFARHPEARVLEVSRGDLERVSAQSTPNEALVVAEIPESPKALPHNEWALVLDTIQDPGNLGTIIRIADWFGINHVVCSPGCADFYNPKVVASGMGGHLRVQLHETELVPFLKNCGMPVLAATLAGKPMNSIEKLKAAALLIGNESKGLSEEVLKCATAEVTISKRGGAESLNAAVSAGVLVSHLMPG
jgi:TrmH family RNA methyltransferase